MELEKFRSVRGETARLYLLDGAQNLKRLLTVRESAAFLGLSERTLYNTTRRGASEPFPVKPVRIGTAVRFDIRDLCKFIADLKKSN